MIKLIVAWDENKLIGKGAKLPWHIPEELKFFQNQTMNQYLLMGETTFLALPHSLQGRKIIVLSWNNSNLGYKTIDNFQYVIDNFQSSNKDIYIAGGKSIYEQFYKYAVEIYVSEIKGKFDGDVHLNIDLQDYVKNKWQNFKNFIVYKYVKKKEEQKEER